MNPAAEATPMDHDSAAEVDRLRELVRYLAADDNVTALRLEVRCEQEPGAIRWGMCVTAPGFDEERLARALLPLMREIVNTTMTDIGANAHHSETSSVGAGTEPGHVEEAGAPAEPTREAEVKAVPIGPSTETTAAAPTPAVVEPTPHIEATPSSVAVVGLVSNTTAWPQPGALAIYQPHKGPRGFTGKIEGAPFMVGGTSCVKLVEMEAEYGRPVVKAAALDRLKPPGEVPAPGSSEDWPAEEKPAEPVTDLMAALKASLAVKQEKPADTSAVQSLDGPGDAAPGTGEPTPPTGVPETLAAEVGAVGNAQAAFADVLVKELSEFFDVAPKGGSAAEGDTRPGEASSGDLGSSPVDHGEGLPTQEQLRPDAVDQVGALEPQSAPVVHSPDWLYNPMANPEAHCFPDGVIGSSLCGFGFSVGGQVWKAPETSPVARCEKCTRALALGLELCTACGEKPTKRKVDGKPCCFECEQLSKAQGTPAGAFKEGEPLPSLGAFACYDCDPDAGRWCAKHAPVPAAAPAEPPAGGDCEAIAQRLGLANDAAPEIEGEEDEPAAATQEPLPTSGSIKAPRTYARRPRLCQVVGCGEKGSPGKNQLGVKDGTGLWCEEHNAAISYDERRATNLRTKAAEKASKAEARRNKLALGAGASDAR
jgi:hypothetical protein